jgi:glycerol-3-phosphate acyltransferase PlsY
VLDAVKGALAAGAALYIALPAGGSHVATLAGYVGLAFALVGHSFSCFTRFRGGKGVATAAGGLFVLMPLVAAISMALWLIIFYTTRYVSVASIAAAISLPFSAFFLPQQGRIAVAVATFIALFVVIRHRGNIARLLSGTERGFAHTRSDPPPGGHQP